jgi:hypothetical protein
VCHVVSTIRATWLHEQLWRLLALPFVILAPRSAVTRVRRACHSVSRRIGLRRVGHWVRRQWARGRPG